MALLKRAFVSGLTSELVRQGVIGFMSKQAEDEVADAVADNLTDEELPEETPEEGLTPEQAEAVLDQVVQVAQALQAATGGDVNPEVNKLASVYSIEDLASYTVNRLFEKAAEECSGNCGPIVPGQGPVTPDLSATAEAELDATLNPSSGDVAPQGQTAFDDSGSMVGSMRPQEQQPGTAGGVSEGDLAKLSALLTQATGFRKQAADGASLSGGSVSGTAPTPRIDVADNLELAHNVVAPGQGKSIQNIPAGAAIGVSMRQPGGMPGPSVPATNEPAKDALKQAMLMIRNAPNGAALWQKMAATMNEIDQTEAYKQNMEQSLANALSGITSPNRR